MGPQGMKEVGEHIVLNAHYALKRFKEEGLKAPNFTGSFFGDVSIVTKCSSDELSKRLIDFNILGGLPLGRFYQNLRNVSLFSFSELHTADDIERLISALKQIESVG
jgi:glycine dehydrogenase subunit 1